MRQPTPSITLLHHLRWLSAMLVAISHIRQNMLVDYAAVQQPGLLTKLVFAVAGFGHTGVVIFFVLSGFLVGGKAISLLRAENARHLWPTFLLDRFSRIFVVLWPALALTGLVLATLSYMAPNAPFMNAPGWGFSISRPLDGDRSLQEWAAAALLLNGLGVETLQSNSPLWSLAYEWYYYVASLAFILAWRRIYGPAASAVMLYAALLSGFGLVLQPAMLWLGLVWLFGVVARIAFDRQLLTGAWLRIGAVGLVLVLLGVSRSMTVPDLAMGFAVALLIGHRDWANWHWGNSWGASLAGFSYSLYVVHFPISLAALGFLYRTGSLPARLPFDSHGVLIACSTLAFAIMTGWAFALVTEYRTPLLRNALLSALRSIASLVPRRRIA